MNQYNKPLPEIDTRIVHDRPQRGKKIQAEFQTTDEDAQHYAVQQSNRNSAIALLNKLKSRPVHTSKIIWKDQQPTIVETTRLHYKTPGLDLSDGLPATDTQDRLPSSWEAKLDKKRRRQYTLEETPTMQFASSGMLGPEYYVDEDALEAYINSLEKDDATVTD